MIKVSSETVRHSSGMRFSPNWSQKGFTACVVDFTMDLAKYTFNADIKYSKKHTHNYLN